MANDTKKLTVTVPATVTFTRAGQPVAFDVTRINPDIAAQLLTHGIVQKVGDSAAGAKKDAMTAHAESVKVNTSDEKAVKAAWDELGADEQTQLVAEAATESMSATMESLYGGEWGRTREASDSDPLDRFRAGIVRALFKLPANATHAQGYKRRFGAKTVDVPKVNELIGKPADHEPSDGDIARARTLYLIAVGNSGELVDKAGKSVSADAITAGAERAKAREDEKRKAEAELVASLGDIGADV